MQLSIILICTDRNYKGLKKREKKKKTYSQSSIICLWYPFYFIEYTHLTSYIIMWLWTDGSNKKGTSWVQDCLSRGNFENTSNSEVPSKGIFLTDITPVLIIMFCRISKDFSLLIITHSMLGLAIETLMNLVTERWESRRARYLLSIPRCASWIDVFFFYHSIFFSSHRVLTKCHEN